MVGGTADAVHRAEPVFSCYADTIFHLGPTGAGMTLKIVNNLLYAAHVSLGREAIGLAVQNGISAHDALAALRRGSAESSPWASTRRATIRTRYSTVRALTSRRTLRSDWTLSPASWTSAARRPASPPEIDLRT
jgi:3-hydroxyisobutyrate dehydrogenase-like beta-hydroxyacid dehydrogenase